MTSPLRARFGAVYRFDFYTKEALESIVSRAAALLKVPISTDGAKEIALRARGTPRIALRLLRRVRDYAQVRADGSIDAAVTDAALRLLDIDDLGLDDLDRQVLRSIIEKFGGGPVGLETIGASISEESDTIMDVVEPYLLQLGFLERTPRAHGHRARLSAPGVDTSPQPSRPVRLPCLTMTCQPRLNRDLGGRVVRTSDFDYHLPAERIAQTPIEPRDASRLLVVHRQSGQFEHRTFADIGEYLRPGDVLVANDSRVLPARLHGRKESGGQIELLLLTQVNDVRWEALVRGHRLRPGVVIELPAAAALHLRAQYGGRAAGRQPRDRVQPSAPA